MSNEPPGGDDSASTSFEAWLDQQAESQGMTREELFEQLVSSYWTLNEMTQLLDDSGSGGVPLRGRGPYGPDEQSLGSPGGADRDGAATDADRSPSGDADPPSTFGDRLDELEAELEEVDADLQAEVEHGRTLDQLFDTLADRLTEVESELDEVVTTTEASRTRLSERIEALESELTDRQEALEDDHEQIEEWLNAEFDSLRTILEYLLDRTDELEGEIASAESTHERELERLRAEREAIQSITREATAQDVHEGACEACGETIDLDLLTRPYCPHCDAALTGVETDRRFWLLTETTVTADDAGRDGSRPSVADERSTPLPSRERPHDRERDREPEPEPDRGDRRAGVGGPASESTGPTDRSPSGDGPDTRPEPDHTAGEPTTEGRRTPPATPEEPDADRAAAERPPESLDLDTPFGDGRDPTGTGDRDDGSRGPDDPGDETDAATSGAGETADDGSPFEFGGATETAADDAESAADPDPDPARDEGPFGDLEDLRREENGDTDR